MGETPDELKAEIAGTRADMTATLDAITDRASPTRVANRQVDRLRTRARTVRDTVMGGVSDIGGTVMGSVGDIGDTVRGSVGDLGSSVSSTASGTGDQLRQVPGLMQSRTRGNPMAAGLIAFGAGLLVASVLPTSEPERQAAATVVDRAEPLVHQAQEAAQEVVTQLQSSASESLLEVKRAASDAVGQVRQEVADAGAEVAETAKSSTADVKDVAKGS